MTQTTRAHSRRARRGFAGSCLEELFFAGLAAAVVISAVAAFWNSGGSGCQVSGAYPQKVLRWCGLITEQALEKGLPPDLVAALIWQESGGSPQIISRSGAVGLMQVMPSDGIAEKFQCKNGPCFSNRPTIQQLKDPEFNVRYGTHLLQGLIRHHGGDLREALKSYGPMDAGYSYADTVLALYQRYGDSPSP